MLKLKVVLMTTLSFLFLKVKFLLFIKYFDSFSHVWILMKLN